MEKETILPRLFLKVNHCVVHQIVPKLFLSMDRIRFAW